jgi:general secretion pathway protein G
MRTSIVPTNDPAAAPGTATGAAGKRRRSRRQAGFTLLELLVVLVILGLIAGLAAPQVMNLLGGAKTKTAALNIEKLSATLDIYRLDNGSYPPTSPGLGALMERPDGASAWNGPYLRKADQLLDPWGRIYHYRLPGKHGAFDLFSLGSDDQEGGTGEDSDVVSW